MYALVDKAANVMFLLSSTEKYLAFITFGKKKQVKLLSYCTFTKYVLF